MNVLLVHGSFGKPFENWFPWLEEELSKQNIVCTIPTFPTPNHQIYSDWENLLNYYYALGIINENTILIGHSCGAICLVHYLFKNKIKVAGLITVSGYNNFYSGNELMDNLNGSFYVDSQFIDIKKHVPQIVSYYGNDDPNIPQNVLSDFAKFIHAEEVVVPNAGHFNSVAGYTKCEIILKKLIELNNEHKH